jgi:hypothetical protein
MNTPNDQSLPVPDIDPATFLTIVSGLPRSGTSMMMQMLVAGGMTPLTDGARAADDDNPYGYYELDVVKRLRTDNDWLLDARGNVVKIIAQLVEYLPEVPCRVVFMRRDLNAVLQSQQVMLARSGAQGAKLSSAQLVTIFAKQVDAALERLANSKIPVLEVDYARCTSDPVSVAAKVNQFLGGSLDEGAMVAAVDPQLHHHRADG